MHCICVCALASSRTGHVRSNCAVMCGFLHIDATPQSRLHEGRESDLPASDSSHPPRMIIVTTVHPGQLHHQTQSMNAAEIHIHEEWNIAVTQTLITKMSTVHTGIFHLARRILANSAITGHTAARSRTQTYMTTRARTATAKTTPRKKMQANKYKIWNFCEIGLAIHTVIGLRAEKFDRWVTNKDARCLHNEIVINETSKGTFQLNT